MTDDGFEKWAEMHIFYKPDGTTLPTKDQARVIWTDAQKEAYERAAKLIDERNDIGEGIWTNFAESIRKLGGGK